MTTDTETMTDYLTQLEQACPLAVALYRLHNIIELNRGAQRYGDKDPFTDKEIAAAEARVAKLMKEGW